MADMLSVLQLQKLPFFTPKQLIEIYETFGRTLYLHELQKVAAQLYPQISHDSKPPIWVSKPFGRWFNDDKGNCVPPKNVMVTAVVVVVRFFCLPKMKKQESQVNEVPIDTPKDLNARLPLYTAQPIMTPHERSNYERLRPITDKLGLEIFPKVCLLDLLKPNEERTDYTKCLNMVKAKHVDFVIWNPINGKVVLILEISDSSHERYDRQVRDSFVRNILERAGYNFADYLEVQPEKMKYKLEGLLRGH